MTQIREQTYVILILIYIFSSGSISAQVKGKSCGMVVIEHLSVKFYKITEATKGKIDLLPLCLHCTPLSRSALLVGKYVAIHP